jgi:hypothetical protein
LPSRVSSSADQTVLPSRSTTSAIVVRGISTPPFATALYAPSRSIGCTSSVPMPIDVTGFAPGGKDRPMSFQRS